MSASVTHQRVSDVVSVNGVNRVNRAQGGGARAGEDRGGNCKGARQVWSNVEALKALLARADRELAREPGGYVAVAVVGEDKREEQVGRSGWAGSRDAGGRIAILGNGLVASARGLRVRVHREGGGLVGSALLRRTAAAREAEPALAARGIDRPAASQEPHRLAALEAQLAKVVARAASQEREMTAMKEMIMGMGPVRESMQNFHARLDELEAVALGPDADDEGDEEVDWDEQQDEEDEGADEDPVEDDQGD
jgi:hypothetical protein